LAGQIGYYAARSDNRDTARALVRLSRLPDLSVATEARFLRFRSLSDIYSPFNEGPEMVDYFPASFTYAPAMNIERGVPSVAVKATR
jgi:hypothetical protein